MASDSDAGAGWWQRYGKTTVLLLVFFLAALFIRSYFNFDASYNDGDFRWSGTDGYYHMRVIDHLRETGEFLLHDGLINYPIGATNPRPPLFDWTIGAVGGLLSGFFDGDAELATDHVAAFAPAVWGALTVFPVFFLGREVFGRRAGLWSAGLVAIMAAHITRSNLGALDHDATILFFFSLGAFFFAKALNLMKNRTYVEDYRDGGSIMPGIRSFFADNQAAVAYAALTGAAFAGIALTWKGYTYAYAVFAVWFGFQMLANHLRRVDNTPYFLLSLVPFIVTLIMIWPYYATVGRIESAVYPTVGILLGVIAAALIFVPTRHLPPVLVLPLTAGGIAVALIIMLVVLPAVGQLYFTGLGYFVQNKLYSTIAEAQRTPLGYLVFSTGVIPFFFALAGIIMAISSFVKKRRDDHLFALVWAAVGLFMAFTATRFVFNASIGFALMAGWVIDRFIQYIRFGEVSKAWRSVRSAGYGLFRSVRSSVGVRHVLASIFIVFMLLLPNVWLGVDAGVPGEYVQNQINDENPESTKYKFWTEWFGAFGQDFLSSHWIDSLGYLADQDQELDPDERPAFMAWWDYGFYAAQRGEHPTVADPFQFGYQISGRFLASQTEAEAITFMSIRLLEGDSIRGENAPRAFSNDVVTVLDDVSPGLAEDIFSDTRSRNYDPVYERLEQVLGDPEAGGISSDAAVKFYGDLVDATGNSIRYATLDGRMFPCDDPRSPGVDSGSIFYAPVYLADKNPEDFVKTKYLDATGQTYYQRIYETTDDGGSRQVDDPYVVDNVGNKYLLSGGTLFPMGENGFIDYSSPLSQNGIQLASAGELEYQDPFYNSWLYRAWVGPAPEGDDRVPPPDQYAPGHGLEHFRLVYTTVRTAPSDDVNRCFSSTTDFGTTGYTRGVSILKYYEGAPVSGVVRDSNGQPMEGVTVQVADNFGIPHDAAVTGTDGRFELLAPFSTEEDPSERAAKERSLTLRSTGPNELQVVVNGQAVIAEPFSVTDAQAMGEGPAIPEFELTVELGTVEGIAFDDVDGDGQFNATTDAPLSNVNVTTGDLTTTTDNAGRYAFSGVAPGSVQIAAQHPHYEPGSASTQLEPGGAATANIAMTASNIPISGVLSSGGAGVEGVQVTFTEPVTPDVETPDERQSGFSDANGNYTIALPRGTWDVSVDMEVQEDGQTVRYFTTETQTIELNTGDPPMTLDLDLEREVVS